MKRLQIVAVVLFMLFAFSVKAGEAEKKETNVNKPEYVIGKYDAKLLMPLGIGNSWTYRWKSEALKDAATVKAKDPIYKCLLWYRYKDKSVRAKCFHHEATAHEETYTIVRADYSREEGNHYFYTVTSKPEVPVEQLRDGRYEDSQENCWTWWSNVTRGDGPKGLTESIKRDWSIHKDYLLGNEETDELPADHRNVLHIEFRDGEWGANVIEFTYANKENRVTGVFKYNTQGVDVEVPAGKFKNCVEFIEVVPKDKEDMKNVPAKDATAEKDAKPAEPGKAAEPPKIVEPEKNAHLGKAEKPAEPQKPAEPGRDAKAMEPWVDWETHTFWAPGVGMVREYQKRPDGSIAYELELLKFGPIETTKEVP